MLKVRTISHHLTVVGKPISKRDLVMYTLASFNYNPFVTSFDMMIVKPNFNPFIVSLRHMKE